jgi:polar amino acid transport system ATP-binding protein
VLAVIRSLARQGMTMVIVTHEMAFARTISTRVFYMDEGTIHEQGTPTEIFDTPRREKTRSFIRRIRRLEFHITSPDYDLYALNAEIEAFGEKHILPGALREHLVSLVEEVLALQPSFEDVKLGLAYSERDGRLEFVSSSAGPPLNVLESGVNPDELGPTLIRWRCEATDYRYEDGRNVLTLQVRGTSAGD